MAASLRHARESGFGTLDGDGCTVLRGVGHCRRPVGDGGRHFFVAQFFDDVAHPFDEQIKSLLIYTANLTLAVYQVEKGVAAVEKIGHDSGGYLSLRDDHAVTIRVPRDRFDDGG